jgi:hypothetical protein
MPYKNLEARKAYAKTYREKNKDRTREHMKAYHQKYYLDHKEHYLKMNQEWRHSSGRQRPMDEATDCSNYLGIHIAERVLSKFFDNITRMPIHNPGYDFICGKGFKIDVKSACVISKGQKYPFWHFNIFRNMIADYYLCLAFDNRESLEPQHVWLIPGNIAGGKCGIRIFNTPKSLAKWSEYERPLDKVLACCQEIKAIKV